VFASKDCEIRKDTCIVIHIFGVRMGQHNMKLGYIGNGFSLTIVYVLKRLY